MRTAVRVRPGAKVDMAGWRRDGSAMPRRSSPLDVGIVAGQANADAVEVATSGDVLRARLAVLRG